MADEPDEDLYASWRDGDAAAGTTLAARHGAAVLRFFANKVPDAAEDLMQRTFLACMTTKVEAPRSFRALLFGIARKQLLRHFEGRGQLKGEEMMSHISLAALATTPTRRIAAREAKTLLNRALETLPIDYQIALELRFWQHLSVSEIADSLGLTEAGARTRLHRARSKLRESYEALSGNEPLRGFDID